METIILELKRIAKNKKVNAFQINISMQKQSSSGNVQKDIFGKLFLTVLKEGIGVESVLIKLEMIRINSQFKKCKNLQKN